MSEKKCVRCGSTENLEDDHIIPKSEGGTDEPSNKRWLCEGCHDYRHARDKIIIEINIQLKWAKTGSHNPAKLSMWLLRLGVLEAFNTPELMRERKKYLSYWSLNATHYSVWYPRIKFHTKNSRRVLKHLLLDCFSEDGKEGQSTLEQRNDHKS